jgi:maltose alpha-D-glucosyltransferase/alpha-amylase
VAAQESDPASLLNRVRTLITLRKAHPALCASGEFEVIYAEGGRLPFVYRRHQDGQTILVALNPADRPAEVTLPPKTITKSPLTLYGKDGALAEKAAGWQLSLPGVSGGAYSI